MRLSTLTYDEEEGLATSIKCSICIRPIQGLSSTDLVFPQHWEIFFFFKKIISSSLFCLISHPEIPFDQIVDLLDKTPVSLIFSAVFFIIDSCSAFREIILISSFFTEIIYKQCNFNHIFNFWKFLIVSYLFLIASFSNFMDATSSLPSLGVVWIFCDFFKGHLFWMFVLVFLSQVALVSDNAWLLTHEGKWKTVFQE